MTDVGHLPIDLEGLSIIDTFPTTGSVEHVWEPADGGYEVRKATLTDPDVDVSDLQQLGEWALSKGVTATDVGNCAIYRNTNKNKVAIAYFREVWPL